MSDETIKKLRSLAEQVLRALPPCASATRSTFTYEGVGA